MILRRVVAAGVLVVALALSACSGLPTSGPVNAGLSADDVPTVPDLSFRPNSPQPGATPSEIVTGFLLAATSPEGNWLIAKEFLADDFREQWLPTAGVTIDQPGGRELVESDDGGSVTLGLTIVADVDQTGAYDTSVPDETTLPYELVEQDGEWRISSAPDGIVLESDFFERVYRPYSVMYYDPTWTFLVPDVRWFAYRSSSIAAWIAQALIDGAPSPWLAGSVASAFPEEVALAGASVAVDAAGVAQVELTDAALRTQSQTRERMQRQLIASLRSAGITDADMVVDGTVLETEPAPVASTAVEPWALVSVDGVVGYLSADGVEPVPGGIGAVLADAEPDAIALGRGGEVAAARLADGAAARVTVEDGAAVVDARAGLVDPAIDPANYIWSAPAASPARMVAVGADGVARDIADAWPQASRLRAMEISRDGTRMAAIVTEAGRDWAVVAGIVRDAAGVVPTGLGPAYRVALLDGVGDDIAWLDDQTVGVLVRQEDDTTRLLTQTVGGLGSTSTAPEGEIVSVTAGTTLSVPRILGADGILSVRRGASWTQSATDVQLLGSQLGAD